MSEKEHHGLLQTALRNVMMPEGRRRRQSTTDDMTEADAEDNTDSTAKRKGKARMSDTGHMVSGGSSPESHHATPPTVSSHHYPPTSSVEGTSGEGSPTIIHAAKVLKQAVLHDARNLRRGTSVTAGSSWTISSPNEAKVCDFNDAIFCFQF